MLSRRAALPLNAESAENERRERGDGTTVGLSVRIARALRSFSASSALNGSAGLAVAVSAQHRYDFLVFDLAEVEVEAADGAEGPGRLERLEAHPLGGELAHRLRRRHRHRDHDLARRPAQDGPGGGAG